MRTLIGFAAGAAAFAASAATAFAVDIQEVVSPGGVKAWLVEEKSVPIISIEIGFDGGASLDPAEKAGRARLFAGLLDEGAGELDASAFLKRKQETAVRLSFDASRDAISVGATMLSDRRDESLELLRLALTQPRFDEAAIQRVQAQLISQIQQSETDPDSLAARKWFELAFPDDAYGAPTTGSIDTVRELGRDDLIEALPLYFNKKHMTVGVVGPISADELGAILDDTLGGLADGGPELPGDVPVTVKGGIEIIEFDAPQSSVLFGHAGLKREDPDFIPAFVMNYVLGGGGFESRLMTEIREKNGLAYSAYSYLAPLDRAGVYLGGVATRNDAVAESIRLVRQEWADLAENGIAQERLDRAKTYLTGAYPLRFDSNGKIARFLVGVQQSDLGINYVNERNGLVEAVTVDDIKRVAERLLKPEDLTFVVVGKPEGL